MPWTDKLKLKKELPLVLVNAPGNLAGDFEAFLLQKGTGKTPQAVLFAANADELSAYAAKLITRLEESALLWMIYPKKSGSIKTDLSRDEGWKVVFELGYEPVTSVAVDADWTALRFKKKEDIGGYIRGTPMEERQVEGIDFKNRTVVLPEDALQAMGQHKGMTEFFYAMAFSHKKEYVIAITEAKKPETRASRIAKMVDKLAQMMAAKKK